MATSNVVIGEGQITFKGVQGHKHDGITSTLRSEYFRRLK